MPREPYTWVAASQLTLVGAVGVPEPLWTLLPCAGTMSVQAACGPLIGEHKRP